MTERMPEDVFTYLKIYPYCVNMDDVNRLHAEAARARMSEESLKAQLATANESLTSYKAAYESSLKIRDDYRARTDEIMRQLEAKNEAVDRLATEVGKTVKWAEQERDRADKAESKVRELEHELALAQRNIPALLLSARLSDVEREYAEFWGQAIKYADELRVENRRLGKYYGKAKQNLEGTSSHLRGLLKDANERLEEKTQHMEELRTIAQGCKSVDRYLQTRPIYNELQLLRAFEVRANASFKSANETIATLRAEVEEYRARLWDVEREYAEFWGGAIKYADELREKYETLSKHAHMVAEECLELRPYKSECENLRGLLKDAEDNVRRLTSGYDLKVTECEDLKRELAKFRTETDTGKEITRLQGQIQSLRQELGNTKTASENHKKRILDYNERMSAFENRIHTLACERNDLKRQYETKCAELKAENESLTRRVTDMQENAKVLDAADEQTRKLAQSRYELLSKIADLVKDPF